jgi:hypothetical protein
MANLDHPPKIGKTGTQKIRDLLDDRSGALADASQKMVEGFTQKTGDQEFKVRRAGHEGLSDVRAYYRRLYHAIDRVDTKKPSPKNDVLDALRDYRGSLADFDKALGDNSDNQVKLLKKAAARSTTAAIALAKARDRL